MVFKNKAFTLLEILIVVIIMAITGAVATLSYRKAIKKAGAKEAEAQVELIYDAEAQYALDNNDEIKEFDFDDEDLSNDLGINPNAGPSNFEYKVEGSNIDDIKITGQAKSSSKYDGVEVKYDNGEICTKLSSTGDWLCKDREWSSQ